MNLIDLVIKAVRGKRGYLILPVYEKDPPKFMVTVIVYESERVLSVNYDFDTLGNAVKLLESLKEKEILKGFIDNIEANLNNPQALPKDEVRQKNDIRKN